MLNDKEIKPDLFSEDNIEENKDNTNLKNKEKNNELEYENIEPKEINNNINYNDQLIIEKNELEKNTNSRNETELPDSNIESEIESYDVSFILFKFKYIVQKIMQRLISIDENSHNIGEEFKAFLDKQTEIINLLFIL